MHYKDGDDFDQDDFESSLMDSDPSYDRDEAREISEDFRRMVIDD